MVRSARDGPAVALTRRDVLAAIPAAVVAGAGLPPYPVERTLLTTCVLAAAVDSLHEGQKRIDTPDLRRVRYSSPRESTFWRS
jgi:hypothetical protein